MVMRVLHVSPSIARSDGGPSEAIRHLTSALTQRGVSVGVATTDKGVDSADREFIKSVEATVARHKDFPPGLNYATSLLWPLWQAIRRSDVVHVHSVNTYVSSAALSLSRLAHKPVVLQPHGALTIYQRGKASHLRRLYARTIDRSLLRLPQAIIVSSNLEADELPKSVMSRICELPLGVESLLLTNPRNPDELAPFILFLGRVTEKKRLDLVIRAMSSSGMKGIRLKVAGPVSSDLGWSPEELVYSMGLDGRVDFLGKVAPESRRYLLSAALAFILPSDDESFGIAAAEAMAAGCPTIVSNRVGAVGSRNGEASSGAIVVAQSAEAISDAVSRIYADGHYAEHCSHATREYARANFDWSIIADNLIDIYKETVEAAGGHSGA